MSRYTYTCSICSHSCLQKQSLPALRNVWLLRTKPSSITALSEKSRNPGAECRVRHCRNDSDEPENSPSSNLHTTMRYWDQCGMNATSLAASYMPVAMRIANISHALALTPKQNYDAIRGRDLKITQRLAKRPEELAAYEAAVDELLKSGAVEELPLGEDPRKWAYHYMCGVPVFANQRKSTRCRICIDARELNNFTNKEGDEEAADMDLQSRMLEWRASKRVDCEDLKKAFWSVHIDESDVKWLGMCVGSRIIRWIHVPFGTNWSPWALSSVLGKILKQIGGTDGAEAISFYVDDVLLRGDSCSEVSKIRREVVPALEERGFEVHQDKRMSNLDTGEDCIGRGVSKEKILSEKFRTGGWLGYDWLCGERIDVIDVRLRQIELAKESKVTESALRSAFGKFFDPMGLFAEVSLELRWAARLAHERLKQRRKDFEDGLVYTPAEEAQHFARFEEELRIQSELISTEDLTVLYDETRPAIMQSLVDEINSKQNTWTASTGQKRFKNLSLRDAKMLCGTLMRGSNDKAIKKGYAIEELQDLPTDFDARTAFPNCSKVIGHIRDQSACGSCWAFGVTEAFNDRLCIKSNGTFTELLSAGEMNACAPSHGCNGGFPNSAWSWVHDKGIATGGDYVAKDDMTKDDGCWPYDFPPCAHHINDTKYPECPKVSCSGESPPATAETATVIAYQNSYETPNCAEQCHNPKYTTTLRDDRHFMLESSPYQYSVNDAKNAIRTDGPVGPIYFCDPNVNFDQVSASFSVYEDFLAYKSGVYKHTSGEYLGGHAVKIIGWGEESGQAYWIVVNSWNEDWGDHGLFKIALGNCGIDDNLLGGTPKV
ncbi:cathepsin b, putative [Perkinsus marinus ATCC 50983]|uniref:Cathepsin b, putative n=1 Tax=Perkinsus marinus (strain ATCC 50983 / TXsc) TaxID=423536 RepID=C5L9K9_PERM5|nr:cathepsin b, putative [Perkinsus marinus ATCC 50983]EER06602.1 cathepsin b, putative [Perkinsus marinus ATCC 50983]|eukprot:XP_002774786.1 cathepsin b, putative [Perkinsus marinus ATCC 50983]